MEKEYHERLLKSFPKKWKNEVERVLNILPLDKTEIKFFGGNIYKVRNLIHTSEYEISLKSERLIIPYRLYFDEPKEAKEKRLSEIEKEILNCIYLRHHDGYLRERRLNNLLNSNNEFIIPFTIQLLGEYVFEILEVLEKHINESNLNSYKAFTNENPKYWKRTESRMSSYWDAYYRYKSPKLKEYLGYELVQRIKKKANAQQCIQRQ